jgi:hypothetical protein
MHPHGWHTAYKESKELVRIHTSPRTFTIFLKIPVLKRGTVSDTPKPTARKLLLADCRQLLVFHTSADDMGHYIVT